MRGMRKLSTRERLYAMIAVIAVVISVGYRTVVMPAWQRSHELSRRITETQRRLERYAQLLSREQALRARFERTFAAGSNTLQGDQGTLAMAVVQSVAAEAGVVIVDIRPQGTPREYDVYTERLLSVRAQADTRAFIRFIYNLEHSPALFEIRKMTLAVKPKSSVLDGAFTVSQVQVQGDER